MSEPAVSNIEAVRQKFLDIAKKYKGQALTEPMFRSFQAENDQLLSDLIRCRVIADLEYDVRYSFNLYERSMTLKITPDIVVYE